jgi:transcriptional regulator with XRE-family HTH domain
MDRVSIAIGGTKVTKRSPQHVDALVGKNIKVARVQRGISQTQLGKLVDVSFQQIQKYESGENRVGASRLTKIAEVLDVPIQALFGSGRDFPNRPPTCVPVDSLVGPPAALRLLKAFDKIDANGVRVATLHLIEAVGEMDTKRVRAPAAGRRRRHRH